MTSGYAIRIRWEIDEVPAIGIEPVHCYIIYCMHCLSGSLCQLLYCQPRTTLCHQCSETASQALPFRRDYDISAFHRGVLWRD